MRERERERERITIIILINATHNPGITIRLSSIPGMKPNRYNTINNPQISLGIGDTFWNCWTAVYNAIIIYLIKCVFNYRHVLYIALQFCSALF